jgi:hypothetical protein
MHSSRGAEYPATTQQSETAGVILACHPPPVLLTPVVYRLMLSYF